jgi:hypothetical protein
MKFIHQHADYIASADGRNYLAQVYAAERRDHTWEAWCVFFPEKGDDFVAGDSETTQSSGESVRYWASGLTHRYFEGALDRALALDSDASLRRHGDDAARAVTEKAAEAARYARAAEAARDRAREIQVMQRAMRRGIRFG